MGEGVSPWLSAELVDTVVEQLMMNDLKVISSKLIRSR